MSGRFTPRRQEAEALASLPTVAQLSDASIESEGAVRALLFQGFRITRVCPLRLAPDGRITRRIVLEKKTGVARFLMRLAIVISPTAPE